jgi:hypothetical protein
MDPSAKKITFTISAMIVIVIAAGIGVDLWDAHQMNNLAKTGGIISPGGGVPLSADQRLVEENMRLKTENAMLLMEIEALKKRSVELKSGPPETAPKIEPVGEN